MERRRAPAQEPQHLLPVVVGPRLQHLLRRFEMPLAALAVPLLGRNEPRSDGDVHVVDTAQAKELKWLSIWLQYWI